MLRTVLERQAEEVSPTGRPILSWQIAETSLLAKVRELKSAVCNWKTYFLVKVEFAFCPIFAFA